MTLKDDMAADRAVFLDPEEFGVQATYTPSGGTGTEVTVLLDEEPTLAEGDFTRVQTGQVQITANSVDVPNLDRGDTFEIDGTTYTLNAAPPKPDQGGMVTFPVTQPWE